MGMLDPNTLIGILNGKLGNLVFACYPNGKIVVRRRPTVVSAASQAQSSNQALFRQALAYVSLAVRTMAIHPNWLPLKRLMTSRSAAFRSASRFRTARFSSRAKPH